MKKRILLIFLLSGVLPTIQGAGKTNLPPRWKVWLDADVNYIITIKEREVFSVLQSDKERETFKEGFWLQRDPTPGTPANEFKTEHYRRLMHADEYFGRSSMKTGRETDRGRIYVLLGEPISTERFEEGAQNLNPSELWQYQGDIALGLPPFFYILFYKRDSNSDYVLYSPSFDGPNCLFQRAFQGSFDRQGAYKALQNVSGELAEASLTLIPGTGGDASSSSSLSSDILISAIQSLPEKKVKSDWAVAFAKNSEIITIDHTINYLPADSSLFIHQTHGLNILHAIIEPRRLSMTKDENKVFAPLVLNIKIAGTDGSLVHQEEKNISIELSPADFAGVAHRVVAVGDVLPLVDGTFILSYLLRNTESKEFSSIEETVVSPGKVGPSLSRILVLYDVKAAPQGPGMAPFVFDGKKIFPSSIRTLAKGDTLQFYFEIYNPDAASLGGTLHFYINGETAPVTQAEEVVGGRRYFLKIFPGVDLQPGYYTLGIALVDTSGTEIAKAKEKFVVSASTAVPKPWRFDKLYPPIAHPYYALVRAYEYLGLSEPAKAVDEVEPLYDAGNPNLTIAMLLARAYFDLKEDARAVSVLESTRNQENAERDLSLGKSLYRLGRFADALPVLEAALRSIGQTVELLNLAGTACLKLGQMEKGLPYLVRSLELKPDQPEILRAIDSAKAR
jgi:GWxTD domain-containing protein